MKKINIKLFIYMFIISLICITICSKNSFFYCFNDWEDENAFMTVARGWINGLIPYRDLFEQKGPFLYLIFVFANLISKTSFIGVYILEIISMTITLYIASKIIKMYLDEKCVYFILPLYCSIIASSIFFVHGGSAEEFSLPFFSYGLYQLLIFFRKNEITSKQIFIQGLCAGIISMIKFNLLGFYIGFCLSIGITFIISKKYKELFKKSFLFLIGMFIPIIIFIIYFLLNDALNEFIDAYIVYNTNNYNMKLIFPLKIIKSFLLFCMALFNNKIIMVLIIVGVLRFLTENKISKEKNKKYLFFVTFILSFIGIYYGGITYNYYFLFMLPYMLFGLIIIFEIVSKINKKAYLVVFFISIILSGITLVFSPNISFSKFHKEDLVQYKYASIIGTKENSTLLNYGFLDGGFYMASNKIPNIRYFERQNGYMSDYEAFIKSEIDNKKIDYIVIMNYNKDEKGPGFIEEKYNLISSEMQEYENEKCYFLLYEIKEGDL